MGFVFWMSSRARPETFDETPDVLLHGGAFFVMAVLAVRALGRGLLEPSPRPVLWGGILIAVLYGVTDEWHQMMVPERVGSGEDVLYDVIGAVSAGIALGLFWRLRRGAEK